MIAESSNPAFMVDFFSYLSYASGFPGGAQYVDVANIITQELFTILAETSSSFKEFLIEIELDKILKEQSGRIDGNEEHRAKQSAEICMKTREYRYPSFYKFRAKLLATVSDEEIKKIISKFGAKLFGDSFNESIGVEIPGNVTYPFYAADIQKYGIKYRIDELEKRSVCDKAYQIRTCSRPAAPGTACGRRRV